jgi:hypothetical protein
MLDDVKQVEPNASEVLGASSVEWEEMLRQRGAYEESLRTIGAYLDASHAFQASVIEGVDGFHIRHEQSEHQSDEVTRHVGYAELVSLDHVLKRKKRPFGLGIKRTTHRYENTLRALGRELDAAKAYSLLIDEVDQGFLVTYQYLKPSQGFLVRKRMVFLDVDSIERVLEDAYDRRGSLSLLAG